MPAMSREHPIIAVTGSSGAGTTTVRHAIEQIFRRARLRAVFVEGDSFHRYGREAMRDAMQNAVRDGNPHFSHFGPDANLFIELEGLFRAYGSTGRGRKRYYLHSELEAVAHSARLGLDLDTGEFTPWEDIPPDTDVLFYEGLHGGVVDKAAGVDVAQWVDLLVGVVPTVNLEWIQKISRDTAVRGYSAEAVVDTILRRGHDYVHYIAPQFSRTHINFQRVPVVDTSNPFVIRDVPTADESLIVIHFRDSADADFAKLLSMIDGSFLSRPDTLVVPGNAMGFAMELILTPMIVELTANRKLR
jgi:phosphoribulokinase